MTWSWAFGCVNCTWQEMAVVCGLAVLAFAAWLGGLYGMVRRDEAKMKLEKHNEDKR